MRAWIASLAALLAAGTALTAAASSAASAPACSSGRLMGMRASLILLVTARADTVRAGPGSVAYDAALGDSAALARIHGQRFRLDRVGGDVPPALAGAEGGEAVLVPYGAECRDVWPWREARWASPGAQLFMDATLRPRDQWVEGRPTFDVDLVHNVYPRSYRKYEGHDVDPLTPAQVFEMNAALPTWEQAEADPAAAYQGFLRWARAHEPLTARFPAAYAMEEAQEWLQPCVPAYDPHPVAGTYRATVVVRGRDTLTTWFRTDARGYPQCGATERRLDLTAVQPRAADTAGLYVYGSRMGEAAIPATNADAFQAPGSCSSVRLDVHNAPRTDAAGRRRWTADYDYGGFTACFRGDARLAGLADSLYAGYRARTLDLTPGAFQETGDGGMRFEQAWRVGGRTLLEVTATRIGAQTLF